MGNSSFFELDQQMETAGWLGGHVDHWQAEKIRVTHLVDRGISPYLVRDKWWVQRGGCPR